MQVGIEFDPRCRNVGRTEVGGHLGHVVHIGVLVGFAQVDGAIGTSCSEETLYLSGMDPRQQRRIAG